MNIGDIKKVCVIGAGQMGHQIAMLCALAGYETHLQDVEARALAKAKTSLEALMAHAVAKGKRLEAHVREAFANLVLTTSLAEAVNDVDFVIEAVTEQLSVKQNLFHDLDRLAPKRAILVTNSSTIVSSKLASKTLRRDKVCNMHFFYPPLVMDCVEVVMNSETSEETAEIVLDVCERIGKTGLLLRKEIAGFVANRILGAMNREAVKLYEDGIADFETIDTICRLALKHPNGPFELMDLSGLDVVYFAMQEQYHESGDESLRPFACVEDKVRLGELGRKTGKGWYDYREHGGLKS